MLNKLHKELSFQCLAALSILEIVIPLYVCGVCVYRLIDT